jgi:hypothetical protein
MSVENEASKNEVQSANKAVPTVTPGRDGLSDPAVGGSQSMIVGGLIKFGKDFRWTVDGEELAPTRKFLVYEVLPTRTKFVDPPITQILEPGEAPRIEELNEACRDEWRPSRFKPGELEGPWVFRFIAHLVDVVTTDIFSVALGTLGFCRAIEDLKSRTLRVRKMYGDSELRPVVTLDRAPFPTRYDPNSKRPHLAVQCYMNAAGEQIAVPSLVSKTLPKNATDDEAGDTIKY